jgi:uncharacterized protein (TIGR02001 family)
LATGPLQVFQPREGGALRRKEREEIGMRFSKRWMVVVAALATMAGLGAAPASAVSVGADMGVYSQYVWRAVPQTSGKPAVQGDVSVDIGGGLSAGVWFSNAYTVTTSTSAANGGTVDVDEFDWTLDYSGSSGMFGYSVGGILYSYLYDGPSNFGEVYLGGSLDTMLAPTLTIYYTVSDSGNMAYLGGDTWIDLGVSASGGGFDYSGTLSFVSWASDSTRSSDIYNDGLTDVALGVSKDLTAGDVTVTPSITVTIPVGSTASDDERYIYGVAVDPSFIAGVNVAY